VATNPPHTTDQAHRFPPGAILAVACVAQFMVVLDVSIVNVALPSMRVALHMSPSGQQWIINAYTLGFGGLMLLGGRAADIAGAKRIFMAGLVGFTTASFVGGLSTSGAMLIAARSVQGVSGALLAPATLTLITTTFTEPRARTRALGAWTAVMAAGGAVGAVAGGILTQYAGWRWVLYVNVPIGVALFAAAAVIVPMRAGSGAGLRNMDLPGAVSVSGGLVALVYGIVAISGHGGGSPQVVGPIVGGLALLALFVAIEARAPRPLVPLRILRRRSLTTANLLVAGLGAASFSMWYLVSLYLQQVLGYTALQTGLCFLPGAAGIVAGTETSTRLLRRGVGPRGLVMTGGILATGGFLWMSRISASGSFLSDVIVPFVLVTYGTGLSFVPLTVSGTSGVDRAEAGLASGLINTSRQVGAAIGLAALATIASHVAASHLTSDPRAPLAALDAGYGRALLIAAAFTACVALGTLAIQRTPKPAPMIQQAELERPEPVGASEN
jgi:EmrB/QacA subfamily drug resistance transporter